MARRRVIKLTKKWSDYINKHPNSKWLVCGRGPSIKDLDLDKYKDYKVIGVNDIENILKPDYLVIVDSLMSFPPARKEIIRNTKCNEIFVNNAQFGRQLSDQVFDSKRLIEIKLVNCRKDKNLQSGNIVFSNNSTFIACDIARRMGATEINLIGVDFTGHKSLDNEKQIKRINEDYELLVKAFNKKEVKLYNLSSTSKITTIPWKNLK